MSTHKPAAVPPRKAPTYLACTSTPKLISLHACMASSLDSSSSGSG